MGGFSGERAEAMIGNPIVQVTFLLHTGSAAMNVNGATVNVDFTFTPAANTRYFISELFFYMDDSTVTNPTNFGNGGGLTNGILLTISSFGTATDYMTIKTNADAALSFNAREGVGQAALLSTNQSLIGMLKLDPAPVMIGNSSDFIRCRIRDNLTGINFIHMGIVAFQSKEIG